MDKPTTAKGGGSSRGRRGGRGVRSEAPPRGTKVTSTGARGSSSSASKKRTRLVLEVARFEDYRAVAEQLQGGAGDVTLDADVFGVLIGCSGHSPVPAHLVDKVAGVLHREVVLRRGVSVIWGGGDPCFRFKTRGGNVADIARTLLRLHDHHRQGHIATPSSSAASADARPDLLIGAVQRDDYAGKVPAFEEVVVAYHASLAQVGGRPTFGGFETAAAAVPPAYREFLASLRREVAQEGEEEEEDASNKRQRTVGPTAAAGTKGATEDPAAAEAHTPEIATTASKKRLPISGQFLPPEGLYPMAASAGYLSLLPALLGARKLSLLALDLVCPV